MCLPTVSKGGRGVFVEIRGGVTFITAQEAYDLHQQIGSILPELVQPFKPWPREPGDEAL